MSLGVQAALEEAVLDTVLTNAFDATAEKLDAVRKPLQASLHAASLQAARSGSFKMQSVWTANNIGQCAKI